MSGVDSTSATAAATPGVTGAAAFRSAAAQLTSGVTVITTALDGRVYGSTVAAVIPFSDEPAMMLACMNLSSSTRDVILTSGVFAINVLAEEQAWIARQFAGKGDKFAGVSYRLCERTGVPLLDGALSSLACEVTETTTAGTHTGFLGTVRASTESGGRPLTYYRGSFGRWERLREHNTYDQVRRFVLQREVPLGGELDVAALAATFDARPDDVHNALIKLTTESLVERRADGGFEPAPLHLDLIENLYEARASIEIGVVANHVGRVPEGVLAQLEAIVVRMDALRRAPVPDPAEFLSLHTAYHAALVELSGSSQLIESYQRLSIAWVWRSVWAEIGWERVLTPRHLDDLTVALHAGDLAGAVRAIQQYHEEAKEMARIALDRRGGVL
ncbi:flavin reductase [Microbacterium album]|uniref:FCD domain-containing protein n=1 Tax=Microbacterium album TaxID=2053191 RepID=A0A917ML82_9MICO|nr:flavin reductase [Microbacterium album]GGH40987.1 hypothetical protein GCM10010921_13290 [Microbacterium album]